MRDAYLDRYHGMVVVSPDDQDTPRGEYVLEVTSAGDVVLRHYDENLYEDMEPIKVDLLAGVKNGKMTVANCTGAIKRELGLRTMLISTAVIARIESIADK